MEVHTSVQREVANSQQHGTHQGAWPRTSCINQEAYWDAGGVHPQVAKRALPYMRYTYNASLQQVTHNQVTLGRGELQFFCK